MITRHFLKTEASVSLTECQPASLRGLMKDKHSARLFMLILRCILTIFYSFPVQERPLLCVMCKQMVGVWCCWERCCWQRWTQVEIVTHHLTLTPDVILFNQCDWNVLYVSDIQVDKLRHIEKRIVTHMRATHTKRPS